MGEFDKELEDYLSARRRPGVKDIFHNIFPSKPKSVRIPEDVQVYQAEKERKPVLKNIFSKKENDQIIRAKLEVEDAVRDMKEVAKIALLAVKQMPDEQLSVFKQGPEFEKLKQILKRHDLIK